MVDQISECCKLYQCALFSLVKHHTYGHNLKSVGNKRLYLTVFNSIRHYTTSMLYALWSSLTWAGE